MTSRAGLRFRATTAANTMTTACRKDTCTSPSSRHGRAPAVGRNLIACPTCSKKRPLATVNGYAPDARKDVPDPVFVNSAGHFVAEGDGTPAALIRDRFLFCLEPSCGVTYTRSQRSERFKLATLGVDNRSTATTILAVRSLIQLQTNRDLDTDARKLLSFTDNRQDASLQAGHFNDFVQVALLRSALHHACAQGPSTGLRHGDLSRCVLDAMELPFEDYAADPEVRGPARQSTRDAAYLECWSISSTGTLNAGGA